MKKLLIILAMFLVSCSVTRNHSSSPFSGTTKHKPLNRSMSAKEANRTAFHGWNPFTREGSVVYRTTTQWTTLKRPQYSIKTK
jgi:hypothetical protein